MIFINLLQYLNNIIKDDKYIDWFNDENFDDKVKFDETKIDESSFFIIIQKLDKSNIRDIFWEDIVSYISKECITKSIFKYFLENKIALISLAHMNLDDDKLIQLFEYANEALFTVAKRYYTHASYTYIAFSEFLIKYFNNELFYQLLSVKPNNTKKEMILLYYSKNFIELTENVNSIIKAKILSITSDIKEIECAYKQNNYLFNIAISSNLYTPNQILDNLSKIKNVKFACKIRTNSIETKILKNFIHNKIK